MKNFLNKKFEKLISTFKKEKENLKKSLGHNNFTIFGELFYGKKEGQNLVVLSDKEVLKNGGKPYIKIRVEEKNREEGYYALKLTKRNLVKEVDYSEIIYSEDFMAGSPAHYNILVLY